MYAIEMIKCLIIEGSFLRTSLTVQCEQWSTLSYPYIVSSSNMVFIFDLAFVWSWNKVGVAFTTNVSVAVCAQCILLCFAPEYCYTIDPEVSPDSNLLVQGFKFFLYDENLWSHTSWGENTQAAYCHTFGPKFWASSLSRHLAAFVVKLV
jgi:hypothetical protein